MKLSEKDQQEFRNWVVSYLSRERSLTSKQIYEFLSRDDAVLIKHIAKAGKKAGVAAYIGRYLLPAFREEGWLKKETQSWVVNPVPNRCAQCLKPIGEVYMIDFDKNHFCSSDCCDEFDRDYDCYESYEDEYFFLFDSFKNIYPKISSFKRFKYKEDDFNPVYHIQLINLIKDIENIIWDPDYSDIIYDQGADGPFAAEIYRIINILKDDLTELHWIEEDVNKSRPKQKKLYTLIIDSDYLSGPGKNDNLLKNFRQKARNHKVANKNIWTTNRLDIRNKWYYELSSVVKNALNSANYVECPLCLSLSEDKYTHRAIDGFCYCEKCHETVKKAGGYDLNRD
jgi:hypothetical protein